mgnify:CR=1 FL=1
MIITNRLDEILNKGKCINMIGSQKVAGNNNQQAGRDINNISNYFESAKRIPSAIESVLSGLYKILSSLITSFVC